MTAIIIVSYILIWLPAGGNELRMGPAYQNERVCEQAAKEVGTQAPAAWCIPGPDEKQSPNAATRAPRRDDGADRRRRRALRKKLLSDDEQRPLILRVAGVLSWPALPALHPAY